LKLIPLPPFRRTASRRDIVSMKAAARAIREIFHHGFLPVRAGSGRPIHPGPRSAVALAASACTISRALIDGRVWTARRNPSARNEGAGSNWRGDDIPFFLELAYGNAQCEQLLGIAAGIFLFVARHRPDQVKPKDIVVPRSRFGRRDDPLRRPESGFPLKRAHEPYHPKRQRGASAARIPRWRFGLV